MPETKAGRITLVATILAVISAVVTSCTFYRYGIPADPPLWIGIPVFICAMYLVIYILFVLFLLILLVWWWINEGL